MAIPHMLEPAAATTQQPQRDPHVVHGREQRGRLLVGQDVPRLMTAAELREFTGIDRTTFRELQLAGALDDLVVGIGHRRFYSGTRFLALIDRLDADGDPSRGAEGRDGGRRFLAAARRASERKQRTRRHDTRLDR